MGNLEYLTLYCVLVYVASEVTTRPGHKLLFNLLFIFGSIAALIHIVERYL
jgi:hypothetical protein